MAKSPESGHFGLYYDSAPGGMYYHICRVLSILFPCLKYTGGCSLLPTANPYNDNYTILKDCVGASPRCPYYSYVLEYLNPDSMPNSEYISTQHIMDLVSWYLKMVIKKSDTTLDLDDVPLGILAEDGLLGTDGTIGITDDGCNIVLPQRAGLDAALEVITKSTSVTSSYFIDYLTQVNKKMFQLFTPVVLFPFTLSGSIISNNTLFMLVAGPANASSIVVYYIYKGGYGVKEAYNDYISSLTSQSFNDFTLELNKFVLRSKTEQVSTMLTALAPGVFYGNVEVNADGSSELLFVCDGNYLLTDLSNFINISLNVVVDKYELGANSVYDLGVANSIDVSDSSGFSPALKGLNISSDITCTYSKSIESLTLGVNGLFEYTDCSGAPITFYTLVGDVEEFEVVVEYGVLYSDDIIELKLVNNIIIFKYKKPCVFAIATKATIHTSGEDLVFKPYLVAGSWMPSSIKTGISNNISKSLDIQTIVFSDLPNGVCILKLDADIDLAATGVINPKTVPIDLFYIVCSDFTFPISNNGECLSEESGGFMLYPEDESSVACPDLSDECSYEGSSGEYLVEICEETKHDITGLTTKSLPLYNLMFITVPTKDSLFELLGGLDTTYSTAALPFVDNRSSRSLTTSYHRLTKIFFETIVGARKDGFPVADTEEHVLMADWFIYADAGVKIEPSDILGNIVEPFKYITSSYKTSLFEESGCGDDQECIDAYIANIDLDAYSVSQVDPFYERSSDGFSGYTYNPAVGDGKLPEELKYQYDLSFCFGLPRYGFCSTDMCDQELGSSYLYDNVSVFENQNTKFVIVGATKFKQRYVFTLYNKDSSLTFIKDIPVLVSQVGGPEVDIKYKWKSLYNIYTYAYNGSGLNPFKKSDTPDFSIFTSPVFYVMYSKYRIDQNLFPTSRTCRYDYGLIFSIWWPFHARGVHNVDDMYRRMEFKHVISACPTDEMSFFNTIDNFFNNTIIEIDTIEYIYTSYCGDHDFVITHNTPRVLGRLSDVNAVNSTTEAHSGDGYLFNLTADRTDTNGPFSFAFKRKVLPYNHLVGYSWFPFRSCEPARYHEDADVADFRLYAENNDINIFMGYGFECYDLIFRPYAQYSDFTELFVDDLCGSTNPNRYITTYTCSSCMAERSLYKGSIFNRASAVRVVDFDNNTLMYVDEFGSVYDSCDAIPNSLVVDVVVDQSFSWQLGYCGYSIFGDVSGVTDYTFEGTTVRYRNILPLNWSGKHHVVGFERTRMGDAFFIYQALYPFHKLGGHVDKYLYAKPGTNTYTKAYNLPESELLLPMVVPASTPYLSLLMAGFWFPVVNLSPCVDIFLSSTVFINMFNILGYPSDELMFKAYQLDGFLIAGIKAITQVLVMTEANGLTYEYLELDTGTNKNYFQTYHSEIDPGTFKCLSLFLNTSIDIGWYFNGESRKVGWEPLYCYPATIRKASITNDFSINTDDDWEYDFEYLVTRAYDEAIDEKMSADYVLLGAELVDVGQAYHDGYVYYGFEKDVINDRYLSITDNDCNIVKAVRHPVFGCTDSNFRLFYFTYDYGCIDTLFTLDEDNNTDIPFLCDGTNYKDSCFDAKGGGFAWIPSKDVCIRCTSDYYNMFRSLDTLVESSEETIDVSFYDQVYFSDVIEYDSEEDVWGFLPAGGAFAVFYDVGYDVSVRLNIEYDVGAVSVGVLPDFVGDVKVYDPTPFGLDLTISCGMPVYFDGVVDLNTLYLNVGGMNIGLYYDTSGVKLAYGGELYDSMVITTGSVFGVEQEYYKLSNLMDENTLNIVARGGIFYEVYTGFRLSIADITKLPTSTINVLPKVSKMFECIDANYIVEYHTTINVFPKEFDTVFYVPVSSLDLSVDENTTIGLGMLFMKCRRCLDGGLFDDTYSFSQQLYEDAAFKDYILIGHVSGVVNKRVTIDSIEYYECVPSIVYSSLYNPLLFCSTSFAYVSYFNGVRFRGSLVMICGYYIDGDLFIGSFTSDSSIKALITSSTDSEYLDIHNKPVGEVFSSPEAKKYMFPLGMLIKSESLGVGYEQFVQEGIITTDLNCELEDPIYDGDSIDEFLWRYIYCIETEFTLLPSIATSSLASLYGYIPLPTWYAPGHRLDMYSDCIQKIPVSLFHAFVASHGLSVNRIPSVFNSVDELIEYMYIPDWVNTIFPDGTYDTDYFKQTKYKVNCHGGSSVVWDRCSAWRDAWKSDTFLATAQGRISKCCEVPCESLGFDYYMEGHGFCMGNPTRYAVPEYKLARVNVEILADYLVEFDWVMHDNPSYSTLFDSGSSRDVAVVELPIITQMITHVDHKPFGYNDIGEVDPATRLDRGA